MYKAVEKALALLYADGCVHGDVRETNIMVKRDGVDSEDLGDVILVEHCQISIQYHVGSP